MTQATAHRFFSLIYSVLLVLYLGFLALGWFERWIAWGWAGVNYSAIIQIVIVSIVFFFFLRQKLKSPETARSSKILLLIIFAALMVGFLILVDFSLINLLVSSTLVFSLWLHRKLLLAESSGSSSVYLILTFLSLFFFILFVVFAFNPSFLHDEFGMFAMALGFIASISWTITVLCGIFVFFKLQAKA